MPLPREEITQAIEKARAGEVVYYEIDRNKKCEFFAKDGQLRFIVCLYRVAHRTGQLLAVTQKRHAYPDQYGDIKMGTDSDMNLYAGKTISYISPMHALSEMENVIEFLEAA